MKKKSSYALIAVLIITITSLMVYAIGEGNIDTGGGGMGQGSSTNYWSPGNDGVRISVIRIADRRVVGGSIDLTNKSPVDVQLHFSKLSKLSYLSGRPLTPSTTNYTFYNPAQAMPRIISTNGRSNIEAIKLYFTDEQVVRAIANIVGMEFENLISGDYKLLIEPMAYYTFEGVKIATTATEAALYDDIVSGLLRQKMTSLTHKNLPLSMFLETGDLSFSAWQGSATHTVTNSQIKAYLGLGIVRFNEQPPEPTEIEQVDYVYLTDTDVVTAIEVSGGQSDPDHPTTVTFDINGRRYTVTNVFYPEGDSQLVWVKWHTPEDVGQLYIDVTVSGPGSAASSQITAELVALDENPPPNPVADDRSDGFSVGAMPEYDEQTSASWWLWQPWWQSHWVDYGHWEDTTFIDADGNETTTSEWVANWVDEGWWMFTRQTYYAAFSADMTLSADSQNPTAYGDTIKSGYGVNQQLKVQLRTNQAAAVTPAQYAISYFPEFHYQTYWRLLARTTSGHNATFEFKENPYSTYRKRVHFTPIWYPDGDYVVQTYLRSAWTPGGMLSLVVTDKLSIQGNLWDDWHIAPLNP